MLPHGGADVLVCGVENCSDFADFAADREDLFRDFRRLENGLPSDDTFSRVFRLLDPAAFNACFGRFIEDLGAAGEAVAAEGGSGVRLSHAMRDRPGGFPMRRRRQ